MEAVLSLAVSNALGATLLAAAAAVVGCLCRRPAVRHALWLLVLLKFLTPPVVSLPLPGPWPAEVSSTMGDPTALLPPSSSDAQPDEAAVLPPNIEGPVVSTVSESPRAGDGPAPPWLTAVAAVWLCGSLAWWAVATVRLFRFRRLLRATRAAPEPVQEQARRLAALLGLRHCPMVSFVAAPLSPLVWALGWSPRLLLPAELWQGLGAEQRDTLLAHELAHLRRGDHWVRRLEFVVLGLYWWHPVVWWARRRLQEAEEECCDARVVSLLPDAAAAYASALVETVAFLSQTRAAALVGASGAGQVPLLKRRLTMILTNDPSRRSSRAAFWAVVGAGALLLPLTPGAAQTNRTEKPREATPPAAADEGDDANPHAQMKALSRRLEKCSGCHDGGALQVRDWLAQPQGWREAHDEVVRLMDEVRRRQDALREAENRFPAVGERERAEQVDKLQDEIELLKVQVHLKETYLQAATKQYQEDKRRYASAIHANKIQPDTISKEEIERIKLSMDAHEGQVEIRTLEVQESRIRLKQAERRLARLRPRPPENAAVGSREQQEKRLQELEKSVQQLIEEMRKLRQELHRNKPANPGAAEDRAWRTLGLRLRPVGPEAFKDTHPEFRGGLVVTEVRPDGPCGRVGVQCGDILVGLGRCETRSAEDVKYLLDRAGASLDYYLLRGDKSIRNGRLRLGD